jgi:ABC-type branched-subunit amino acid transport system substrate-binding protein
MSENIDRGEQGQDRGPQEVTTSGRPVSRREFMKLAGFAGAGLTLAGGLGGILAACGGGSATTTTAAPSTTATAGSTTTLAAGSTTTAVSAGSTTSVAAGYKTLNDLFGPGGAEAGQGIKWKHGLNTAVTGTSAPIGDHQTAGVKVAIKAIADAGGPEIELFVNDHKGGDVNSSVNGVRRLITQEGIQTLTTSWSGCSIALFPVLQENKLMTYWSGGANPAVVNAPYVWSTMEFFAIGPCPGSLAFMAKTYPNAKKLALIGASDAGVDAVDKVAPQFWPEVSNGGTVVATEKVDPGTTNFQAIVARVKAANPDIIWTSVYGQTQGFCIKAVRLAGITAPMMHIDFDVTAVPETAGETLDQDNYYACDAYQVSNLNPFNKIFAEQHKAMFNTDSEYFSANTYESMMILWTCMRRVLKSGTTNITGDALEKAMLDPSAEHWSLYGGTADKPGIMTFSADHTVSKPMGVFKLSQQGVGDKLATIYGNSTKIDPAS